MNLGGIFEIEKQEQELKKIEKVMASADFWTKDQEEISKINQKRAILSESVEKWNRFYKETEDIKLLAQLAKDEDDGNTLEELEGDLARIEKEIKELKFRSIMSGPDDDKNAIVSINSGAGGTEAQDWVEMLLRMYLKWCDSKGYKVRIIDLQEGEEAGIKSVTFTVSGPYAYGYLKAENGIHRMVRISPFDATGRRHTSFAAVTVLPEVDESIEINIDEKDIRIDTFRASGPGGQHVNKTSSAVRITHLPTGIIVQCQNEKSQHRNREMAMKVLKARLYELEKKKLEQKKQEMHQSHKEIAWGSQIRSYIFNPYRMVKDHRTNVEVGDLQKVMDGEIDIFINAFLEQQIG